MENANPVTTTAGGNADTETTPARPAMPDMSSVSCMFLPLSKEGYCHDISYGCMYVALTGGHILGRISTKLGMMDGCRMGMVTVSGRHGPVITAVTVG